MYGTSVIRPLLGWVRGWVGYKVKVGEVSPLWAYEHRRRGRGSKWDKTWSGGTITTIRILCIFQLFFFHLSKNRKNGLLRLIMYPPYIDVTVMILYLSLICFKQYIIIKYFGTNPINHQQTYTTINHLCLYSFSNLVPGSDLRVELISYRLYMYLITEERFLIVYGNTLLRLF